MIRTAKKRAPASEVPAAMSSQPQSRSNGEDDFYGKQQHVWNKVLLLNEVGFIKEDDDQYLYAYRLTEMELQKACAENAALREKVHRASRS